MSKIQTQAQAILDALTDLSDTWADKEPQEGEEPVVTLIINGNMYPLSILPIDVENTFVQAFIDIKQTAKQEGW